MKLEVECYSGFKADERPVRFRLDERQYLIEEIVDQWYGTQDVFYKVRADDGNLYVLRRETATPEGAMAFAFISSNARGILKWMMGTADEYNEESRPGLTLPRPEPSVHEQASDCS